MTNLDMTAEYMARNADSLRQLEENPDVEILKFPDSVLENLKALTLEVIQGLAAGDERVARVWDSYRRFLQASEPWQRISEQAYLSTRA